MRHKATFIVVIARTIGHFPVARRLQACRNACRMGHLVLEKILRDTRTAKGIAVVKAKCPLEHFVFAHLRREAPVKIAAPAKAFRKIVAPVNQFRNLHLVRVFRKLVVNAMSRVDGKKIIRQNLETERRCNVRKLQRIGGKVIGHIVTRRQESSCTVLVFDCLRRIALGRIYRMPGHLQILDIEVVIQTKTHRLLLFLIRGLAQ